MNVRQTHPWSRHRLADSNAQRNICYVIGCLPLKLDTGRDSVASFAEGPNATLQASVSYQVLPIQDWLPSERSTDARIF